MRRALIGVATLAVGFAAVMGTAWGGDPSPNDASITVRKVVSGTASSGFTVVVTCEVRELPTVNATLQFDATGAPTTTSDVIFQSVNGAWTADVGQPPGDAACTATETVSAGAASTSWTCDYQLTTSNGLGQGGCAAANGTGTGPVGFTISAGAGLLTQDVTVAFTNTFAAVAAVEATPTTTG